MNKKNIIIFSIAALLLANCAVAMEKDTKKKESSTEKLYVIPYNTKTQKTSFNYWPKVSKNSFLYIELWHDGEGTLTENLNSFFKTTANLGHRIRSFTIMSSCDKDSPLEGINWKKAKYLKSLDVRLTKISAESVNEIIHQLKSLNLTGCKDTSLREVTWEDAKELETLNLSGTDVTTRMVNEILGVTQLISITLIDCEHVKPEEINNPNNVKIILK